MTADSTSGPVGLSNAQATERLDRYGPNALPRRRPPRLVSRVLAQLRDPMILLLLAAGLVTLALGDVADTTVIALVVVLNTAVGVRQELRAERAVDALTELAAPRARVVRGGVEAELSAEEVVPGDLLRLDAGDVIPADARLIEAHRFQVDESAMTGESVPVDRAGGDEVLAGTVVTTGRGTALVTRTGESSGLGRIAALVAAAPVRATPLQQRLGRLSRTLVVVALGLSAVVLVIGLLQGRGAAEMLVVAVSLAVAAVPESLPAVVTVALALGAYRMARRSAIVRWLPAVETLGSVTVIASDKTGTLTEGRMAVQRMWTPSSADLASQPGRGSISEAEETRRTAAELDRLVRDVVLCNDAQPGADATAGVGDPLEVALLAVGREHEVDSGSLRASWPRVAEIPFDAGRRLMSTLHADPGGGWLTVCKGAPEVVLPLACDGRGVDWPAEAKEEVDRLAAEGYRVIAVAHSSHTTRPPGPQIDHGLELAGLVAVADPPRATAREVVNACRESGVRLVLVTGDHPATAQAIARRLGIGTDAPVVLTGDAVTDGHDQPVEQVGVYARTRPEQKVDIVEAWQQRGHVVAMTGDGVNDAPALRRADIGVAMGSGGTEVARQAAALVLADDDLRTVVAAIEEGRRIFTNIRSFLRYALSGGFAEVAVMLVAPFLGIGVPLTPGQILWINMLTHGLPGVAFGAEPLDPAVMKQPSRSPQESVLGGGLARQVGILGLAITAVTLAAGLTAVARGTHVQTSVFVTLGLAQLGVALALRAPRPAGTTSTRALEVAVAAAALLQLVAVWLPPLRELLGTVPIGPADLAIVVALAALPGLALRLGRKAGTRMAGAREEAEPRPVGADAGRQQPPSVP